MPDTRISTNDRTALSAALERLQAPMRAELRGRLRPDDDADDVLQSVFVRLLSLELHFSDDAHLLSYIRTCLRRRCIDLYRRHNRRQRWQHAQPASEMFTPAHDLESADEAAALRAFVDRSLRGTTRDVIQCLGAGDTYEQAAARLRLPLGTVKSAASRARDQLARRCA